MKVKWASLQSVTPQALNLDLCPIKLSEAVAASMSFPPVIGPITFKVEGEDRYWHVGDGGLSDNMGLESLATVALSALQQNGPVGYSLLRSTVLSPSRWGQIGWIIFPRGLRYSITTMAESPASWRNGR